MSVRGLLVSLVAAAVLLLVPTASAGAAQTLTVPAGLQHFGDIYLGDTASQTFTYTSSGTDPVTVGPSSIFNFPGNSEYFSITEDNCNGQTLDEGESCTVKAEFEPTVLGFRYTSVQVPHSGPNSMEFFGIDGTGINPGIEVAESSHDFGSVEVGQHATAKTFSFKNDGTSNLEVSASITGTDDDEFFFDSQSSCAYVDPDASCSITVGLRPLGDAGSRSANLVVSNNTKSENPVTIPLTATALKAHVSTDPESVSFGQVDLYDDPDLTRTVTLKSDGTADLTISDIIRTGTNGNAFSLDVGECADGAVIPAGEDCSIEVTFHADWFNPGSFNAAMTMYTSAGSLDVPLSGTRVAGGMSAESSTIDFGDVEVGQTGTETLTLTSTGTGPLKLAEPEISGTSADMFTVEQPEACSGLTTDQTCEITVHFTPTGSAGKQAYLELSGNFEATGVSLLGEGITAFVNVPFEIAFAETTVGSSVTLNESMLSNGDAPFTLDQLVVAGPNAAFFSVEVQQGGCSDLVRGEECLFDVTYEPTSAGTHTAELQVTGNLETQTIPISGSARNLIPARVAVKLSGPAKAKPGKTLTLTAKLTNSGEVAATGVNLKTAIPKKLAKAVKSIKVGTIPGGKTVTRKVKVQIKKSAKKGGKLKVRVMASGKGFKAASAGRTVKIK